MWLCSNYYGKCCEISSMKTKQNTLTRRLIITIILLAKNVAFFYTIGMY